MCSSLVLGGRAKVRLSSITFQLVGGPPVLSNDQDGKASISGDVLVAGSFSAASCGEVSGDLLVITTFAGADTVCTIAGNGGRQRVSIHTSCSKPLLVKDTFGAIQLVGFQNSGGASEQRCTSPNNRTKSPKAKTAKSHGKTKHHGTTKHHQGTTKHHQGKTKHHQGKTKHHGKSGRPGGGGAGCNACSTRSGSTAQMASLTLQLVGGPAVLSNDQDGKASVSGDELLAGPFDSVSCSPDLISLRRPVVAVSSDQLGIVASFVSVSQSGGLGVAISGDQMMVSSLAGADLVCAVVGPGGTQTFSIHVSCSKPLSTGDTFGAIQLIGFSNSGGSSESQCSGPKGSDRIGLAGELMTSKRPKEKGKVKSKQKRKRKPKGKGAADGMTAPPSPPLDGVAVAALVLGIAVTLVAAVVAATRILRNRGHANLDQKEPKASVVPGWGAGRAGFENELEFDDTASVVTNGDAGMFW